MKVKVIYTIVSIHQGAVSNHGSAPAHNKSHSKDIQLPDAVDTIDMKTVLDSLADTKLMKELLDNRMVSYKNKSMDAFVYIGNYWVINPNKAHKDIKDAS